MKKLNLIVVAVFLCIIMLPMCFFNFEEDYVSQVDNRMLKNNPFKQVETLAALSNVGDDVEAYVGDRIGFRNVAIDAYGVINRTFFGMLQHPFYMKGEDGHIFTRKVSNVVFSDFHRNFAEMIIEIDTYCKERSVPFIFVFNPEKLSVVRDKAPLGRVYENSWVKEFLSILETNGVEYVDNTEILTEKYSNGENVFNKQYDVNHWNDLGAFYGTNSILEKMQETFSEIKINSIDDFVISEKLEVDLQQSGVLVEENTPLFTPKNKVKNITKTFNDEVKRNKNYSHFKVTLNQNADAPKTLMFQGSYMNTRGRKFMENALNEYITVHDYQNILDFEYYYNLFSPECVVFEVAEYTFLDMYFDEEATKNYRATPTLSKFDSFSESERNLADLDYEISNGVALKNIVLNSDCDYAYVLIDGREYNIQNSDQQKTLSVLAEDFSEFEMEVVLVNVDLNQKYVYK